MVEALSKISNTQVFQQFLHDCIDDLIGRNHNYPDSSQVDWTNKEQQAAIAFVKDIYRRAIESLLTESQSDDGHGGLDVHKISSLSASYQQCVRTCFEVRRTELHNVVSRDLFMKIVNKPLVENIDWKVKWIMGSSKSAIVQEPLLQLDLHCFPSVASEERKTVNCEMNLEEVDRLIAKLEKSQSELEELS